MLHVYGGTPKHRDKWCEQCRSKTKCTGTQWHLTVHQEYVTLYQIPQNAAALNQA